MHREQEARKQTGVGPERLPGLAINPQALEDPERKFFENEVVFCHNSSGRHRQKNYEYIHPWKVYAKKYLGVGSLGKSLVEMIALEGTQ